MNTKKFRRFLITIHFLFVGITVSHLYELINWKPISVLMELYSSVSYTNRNFGFFAPTVNDDFNLKIRAFKKDDKIGHNFSFYMPDSENRIRFSTMLWHFAEGNSASQMDLYARSWAIYCMNKDTTIDKVIISVYKNNIPLINQCKMGKRISQALYYKTSFDTK
jgi:hypothetical protein